MIPEWGSTMRGDDPASASAPGAPGRSLESACMQAVALLHRLESLSENLEGVLFSFPLRFLLKQFPITAVKAHHLGSSDKSS